jgi:hypothetical protein
MRVGGWVGIGEMMDLDWKDESELMEEIEG